MYITKFESMEIRKQNLQLWLRETAKGCIIKIPAKDIDITISYDKNNKQYFIEILSLQSQNISRPATMLDIKRPKKLLKIFRLNSWWKRFKRRFKWL